MPQSSLKAKRRTYVHFWTDKVEQKVHTDGQYCGELGFPFPGQEKGRAVPPVPLTFLLDIAVPTLAGGSDEPSVSKPAQNGSLYR